MDEFALVPGLSHVEAGVNFGRSLGLKFILGIQNVGQVLHAYEEARGGSILSGFATLFAFRLFDQLSRNFVAERYGANRKLVRFDSALRSRGVTEHIADGKVIEDWDMSALHQGQSIACLPVGPPFRFQFRQYQPPVVKQ